MSDEVWGWLHPALAELRSAADQPWDELRARFLEQLGLTDPAEQPAVAALLHWLDEMPDEDRTATLSSDQLDTAAYELVQTHAAEPAAQQAAEDGYDEQAWQAFLTTNGPYWDGTAESWPAFRQWFEYHAAEQGLGSPATALLDFLEAQPAAERVTTFASYGVTITPAAAVQAEPAPAETAPAEAAPPAEPAAGEEMPADAAELMELINKLPSADELDAQLAGIPEQAAEEEPAELEGLDELEAESNA